MPEEKVREIADGRIFTGEQAKELGLLMNWAPHDAVNAAAQMAGSPVSLSCIPEKKRSPSWTTCLIAR